MHAWFRELDMTNDSQHFIHTHEADRRTTLYPLYEGRMVHQFDSRAKKYEGGTARRATWIPQALGRRDLFTALLGSQPFGEGTKQWNTSSRFL